MTENYFTKWPWLGLVAPTNRGKCRASSTALTARTPGAHSGDPILLNAKIFGLSIYRTIIFLPSLVPTIASAMLWMWLFNPKLGLVNIALQAIGVSDPPGWLGDARLTGELEAGGDFCQQPE